MRKPPLIPATLASVMAILLSVCVPTASAQDIEPLADGHGRVLYRAMVPGLRKSTILGVETRFVHLADGTTHAPGGNVFSLPDAVQALSLPAGDYALARFGGMTDPIQDTSGQDTRLRFSLAAGETIYIGTLSSGDLHAPGTVDANRIVRGALYNRTICYQSLCSTFPFFVIVADQFGDAEDWREVLPTSEAANVQTRLLDSPFAYPVERYRRLRPFPLAFSGTVNQSIEVEIATEVFDDDLFRGTLVAIGLDNGPNCRASTIEAKRKGDRYEYRVSGDCRGKGRMEFSERVPFVRAKVKLRGSLLDPTSPGGPRRYTMWLNQRDAF